MKIEIIFTPDGKAPLWIRRSWVGVKLEVKREVETPINLLTPANSAEGRQNKTIGYTVDVAEALKVLKDHDWPAYRWYERNFPDNPEQEWFFKRSCCRRTG